MQWSGVCSDEKFMRHVLEEVRRARAKFPSSECCLAALSEEVGELAKACLEESSERIVEEAVQVACMALRVATEGDPSLDSYRDSISAGQHPRDENHG